MQNQEIVKIIENLKGRRNYEEKRASKLGFASLYDYFEDKILKKEKAIKEVWETCKKRLIEKKLDKIVLDEIGMAIGLGFIEENDLISMINNRPSSTDIILTGPSIPPKVMEMADQITELRCN